jgi:hypothetical protein
MRLSVTTDAGYLPVLTGRPTAVDGARKVTAVAESSVPVAPTSPPCTSAGTAEQLPGDRRVRLVAPPALRRRRNGRSPTFPRMLQLFEHAFGTYPQEDCTLVVTPDELEIPLEAQGLACSASTTSTPTSSG